MGAIAASNPIRPIRVLPLRTLSDERLAQLAQAGEDDAFSTLYERYRDALSRYCRSIVRDSEDAGDALQNTMISVLRALQGRGPSGPVRPWLYRIAHNESVSILRRRHPHEELSDETPDRRDPELASLAKYRWDALVSDLRSLPDRQRGALVMRELGGLEYGEIGDALDMSAVSARKHVFEARVALHDIADGRDTDCTEILRRISDGDGRVLRARSVRGHLRGCPSCAAFERGMRTRPQTLGLIPVLPLVTAGTVLAAILHAGGASAPGLAAGGSMATGSIATGSTAAGSMAAGSTAAGSIAAGSTAAGSIAAGSTAAGSMATGSAASGSLAVGTMAAAGSLLGGGSFAAFKGMAIAGALAMAGAGVIVGTGVTEHTHPHSSVQAAASSARERRARAHATAAAAGSATASATTAAAAKLPKAIQLAVAAPPAPRPALGSTHATGSGSTSGTHYRPPPVRYTPPKSHPTASAPNTQAPVSAVPVAATTPTSSSAPTSTTAAPTSTPTPATETSAGATSESASTLWIDSIIETALHSAGASLAAAEAEADQQLSAAGISPYSQTIQALIASIFSGLHG